MLESIFTIIIVVLVGFAVSVVVLMIVGHFSYKAFLKTIAHLPVKEQERLIAERKQRALEKFQQQREARKTAELEFKYGKLNDKLVCPHCQQKGHVRTKGITKSKGISGGKATAALLTGGISLVATGLSQIEKHTQANCSNCNSTWQF